WFQQQPVDRLFDQHAAPLHLDPILARVDAAPQRRHDDAVHLDRAGRDQIFGAAPRGQTGLGQKLLQTHGFLVLYSAGFSSGAASASGCGRGSAPGGGPAALAAAEAARSSSLRSSSSSAGSSARTTGRGGGSGGAGSSGAGAAASTLAISASPSSWNSRSVGSSVRSLRLKVRRNSGVVP